MRLNPFLNGKYEVEQIIENVIKKAQFLEIINGCVYQIYGINNGVNNTKYIWKKIDKYKYIQKSYL